MGCGISGFGCGVWGLRCGEMFRVWSLGVGVWILSFWLFRVWACAILAASAVRVVVGEATMCHYNTISIMAVRSESVGRHRAFPRKRNLYTNHLQLPPTRWSTSLSLKVNSPHTINLRASCGANVVTYHPRFRGNKTLEVHRLDGRIPIGRQKLLLLLLLLYYSRA